jgi:hypothetical protein
MFLVRPQHFLRNGTNRDFSAMKRMSSRVSAPNTPDLASLEKHHGV